MKKRSVVCGISSFLPENTLTNFDLEKIVDTSDEWITTRTGIKTRHVVGDSQYVHDISVKSAQTTLERAQITPEMIDCVLVATTTSEKRCPSSAARVQDMIGAKNAFAFDIQAACSGFIYGLAIADSFIKSETCKNILLIGADTLTLFTDWTDRSTCILFGDGAGSCIVRAPTEGDDRGIVTTKLYSDGSKHDLITIENSEKNCFRGYMTMRGQAVFKCGIENMYQAMVDVLEQTNMTFDDIDWIVPHQANKRIFDSMHKIKGIPIEKVILTIDHHANTSSASIPLALDEAINSGKVRQGDTVMLTALGAGIVWSAAIVKL